MSEIVLKIDHVSKMYPGVRALDEVSLECLAGEVHAILGENGSGKSTLMKIASGVVRPDSGAVEIAGRQLSAADPALARTLGLSTVYQDDSLVRELTVAQNLFLGAPKGSASYSDMNRWAVAQMEPFGVSFSPTALVGDLTPAHRQFVEIVKALLSKPRVLLLDEPTSTLDLDGVRHLTRIVRELTQKGTGIIYVSHRLPEILELADRVTILRDGIHQGTFPVTEELSETRLVSLMIGRDVESEFPPKPAAISGKPVLEVKNLSGTGFSGVSLVARAGEIVGFAGAEGNGQREALRAIGGLAENRGDVLCSGKPVDTGSPRAAMQGGVTFLSADRSGEAVFPELAVQRNMVLGQLGNFARSGLLSSQRERQSAAEMRDSFGVVAASLDVPIASLSGGNQQKSVLARSFRGGAKAILIDEPTQGVDAGARYEIYKAIRHNIRDDGTCVVNSSDAQELAGICDRVLVFSRGRIVQELIGDEVTEEKIVGSFLTSRHGSETAGESRAAKGSIFSTLISGSANAWVPIIFLAMLTVLVGTYATSQSAVFLTPINFRHLLLALAPAGLVAMAQLLVLVVRGLDVSVGSLMSVSVVVASYVISGGGLAATVGGVLLVLAVGAVVGAANGSLIRFANINAVITTIAMLSVLQGLALVLRPIPGGLIDPAFAEFLRMRIGFLPASTLLLLALAAAGDFWLNRTRSGLEVKATGFREEAARRNGVAVTRIQIRAYLLAALLTAVAGLFLASEVGVGHPTVGQDYALTSIAAAVLGGAALSGGRGSFSGALFGAFFFALMVNVISILGLSSSVGITASGIMTLIAIFLYSGLQEFDRLVRRFANRRRGAGPTAVPAE